MAPPETQLARPSTGRGRGLALVCLAGVLWGTIGPAIPVIHAASGLSPLTIGGYRAFVAVVVLVIAAAAMRRSRDCVRLGRRHWRRVVAVGVSTATFQLFFFVAVLWTGVSITTVVCLGFAPVLLLITGSARLRRAPSTGQTATVTVAVLGLLLVSVVGSSGDDAPHAVLGVPAALVSGAAYAFSAEAAEPLTQRLDTLTMTTLTTGVAAMVLIPVGLVVPWASGDGLWTSDAGSWALIGYLGAVTMALAYALLFTGLRTTPSGAAVVATLLEPVTAVVIAVVFLGERLTVAGVVGVVLIMAAIGRLGRHTKEPAPQ
ncbi:DMT family transporter [Amycolatopsis speibonae]|uniref:DMT family transporter n=1 Tax=Amycolatopsis speibonae TaxID=1450224 RepID=A0ABV7NQS6_9PSEU